MSSEITTTRTARLWINEDGITYVATNSSVRHELLDDAKENVTTISRINGGKPTPVLVDIRSGQSIDREIRDYYSSKNGLLVIKALALLVESPITQIMANIFINMNQPSVPTRLFTSEAAAVTWLKAFL
jgi:hypothetical protein